MASNKTRLTRLHLLGLALALLAGCSVTGPRENPVDRVTRGSPTVLEVYRGQAALDDESDDQEWLGDPRSRLNRDSLARPIANGDNDTQRYWSALEPMQQRFARVPNPDLVMVVYPHLAGGKYPVPGYVTVFPMYEQTFYAQPGEVAADLIQARSVYQGRRKASESRWDRGAVPFPVPGDVDSRTGH